MKRTYLILACLILVAFGVRFAGQPRIPYGFHRDEASIGYSAYSLLKTSRDEWGKLFPLHFRALGDYPPGAYQYLTVLSMSLAGPTQLAVRLPAIVLGSLLVGVIYWFVYQITRQQKLGLLASGLSVFSPWFVVQSRASSEAIPALLFSLVGLIFYSQFFQRLKIKYLLAMTGFYLLALYSYNSV
ncbi:MAG: phospholipid carrier-dependent glycosyltransferase, partial [Candidatus Pacebacteria bacterium]|nr:phospholipid carrier-dependent glycosyltransferase [Candidatus Paceibacterota bacterium]